MQKVSDFTKTRRFNPPPELVTTKFVKVEDLTTPFSPYDSLEIDHSLEIEILEVPPEAPACERSLIETTPFAPVSEPYEKITIQPLAGPPSLVRPVLLVVALLAGAFGLGLGTAFIL